MYGDVGHPEARLSKASATKDCDKGGVTVGGWQKVGQVNIPLDRQFVSGLLEEPGLKIENQKHEWLTDEADEEWFHAEDPVEVARLAKIKAEEEAKAKAKKERAKKEKAERAAKRKAAMEKAKKERAEKEKAKDNDKDENDKGEEKVGDKKANDKESTNEKERN